MYVVEIILRNNPMPLSVQRKTVEDADTVYQQIMAAIRSNGTQLLELTCERQPEKKISVLNSEIIAAQIYEKSSTAASGRQPGFFALAQ